MLRDELGDLATFAAVAEAQSFTKAAGRLGASQSALSHTIRRLEARLGVRLLTRTTRSVAPTPAGERLLATLKPALSSIGAELDALSDFRETPSGTLRISTADYVAETRVWPVLRPLLQAHPDILVELHVDNGFVDIVKERFDAGVRLGGNIEKDMIAVPIGPPERIAVVASPAYLADRGTPLRPEDLGEHACINRHFPSLGGFGAWRFSRDGLAVKVRVSGRLAFNKPEMIARAALDGFGVAYVLESQVAALIAEGRLKRLLEDWCPAFPGYHLYYPSRRQNAPALQLIAEAMRYRAGAV